MADLQVEKSFRLTLTLTARETTIVLRALKLVDSFGNTEDMDDAQCLADEIVRAVDA